VFIWRYHSEILKRNKIHKWRVFEYFSERIGENVSEILWKSLIVDMENEVGRREPLKEARES